MTANIQLGNLAVRAGKKIELDENGKITSDKSSTSRLGVNLVRDTTPLSPWSDLIHQHHLFQRASKSINLGALFYDAN